MPACPIFIPWLDSVIAPEIVDHGLLFTEKALML